MAFYVGSEAVDYLTVLNADNTPATGRTVSVVASRDPQGNPFTLNITEIGGGVYKVSFVPTIAGSWFALLSVNTTPVQWWSVEIEASAAPPGPAQITAGRGVTLRQLIRDVARLVRDFREAVATHPGSTTTFRSTSDLYEDSSFFRGAEAVFTGGTAANIGQRRRVASSDIATQTVTFVEPPLPAAVAAGDTIWLINLHGQGWRYTEYKEAINQAIRESFPALRLPYSEVLPSAYTLGQPVPIPATFTHLHTVEWQDTDGTWHALRHGPDGWLLDLGQRVVLLSGTGAQAANGRLLRLTGFARHAELINDDDVTTAFPEYVTQKAAGLLILSQRKEENLAVGQYYINRADALRASLIVPAPANTVALLDE